MGTPLRVLMVEDQEHDAELLLRSLRKESFTPTYLRVDTAEAMRAALREGRWDVVFADYALPSFNGIQALEVLKESGLDVPFILVSGAVRDDTAVAAMRAGAHDYLGKDNLSRLGPAVRRELSDANIRTERRRTTDGLRFLADAGSTLAQSLDYDTTLAKVSRLAVPFLADFCAVHVAEEPERIRWVAAAHADPAREEPLRESLRKHQVEWRSNDPIAVALRTGEPRFVARGKKKPDDDGTGDLWGGGSLAAMVVPMVARQRSLGTISLFRLGDEHDYGPVDLTLAQDLARHSAVAVDNARLYREARDALHARDTFLMCAAHEFKTPLTRLKLQLDAAQRDGRRGDDDAGGRIHKKLDLASREATSLGRLVDEMIEVARVGAARSALALDIVDLTALARDVAERLEGEMAAAGCRVAFRGDEPIEGMWDASRLERVVSNLLRNASRYGASKPIEVAVHGDERTARLEVKDHGIGIAPEDQDRIFECFGRAVSARHYGGFGIGLWVAREAVRSLGGIIRVESAPGEGATFTVELPRRGPADRAPDAPA